MDVVPRFFLREFVNVLDLVDQHADYQPMQVWELDAAAIRSFPGLRPEEDHAAPLKSCFDRLSERLRHGVFHTLGWRSLRPVQEAAIEAVLDGANCLILARHGAGQDGSRHPARG